MEIHGKLVVIWGFGRKPKYLVFLDIDHEFGHGIKNKLYIWVRDVMGNVYLQKILKSGHVGSSVIFIDYSIVIRNCYKLDYYEYLSIYLWVCTIIG